MSFQKPNAVIVSTDRRTRIEHNEGTGNMDIYVGNEQVASVASAGTIAAGTQVAHVADASEAHDLNATFSDTEAEAALNALGAKINAILASLEAFGIHASA